MSKTLNNLGRGLDDLINEVSTVKAVPSTVGAGMVPPPRAKKSRKILILTLSLVCMTVLASVLAWKLYGPKKKSRLSDAGIEVSVAEPLTPMLIDEAGTQPITALDWTDVLRAPGLRIERREMSTRVIFQQALFLSGTAIDPNAPLQQIAQKLLSVTNDVEIVVLGHTNNDPMRPGGPYRTSDDLSFARAVAVVNYLRAQGVTLNLKAGVGPAPHPNTDASSKARNRTVTMEIRTGS